MALVLKDNPVGIDFRIDQIQRKLFTELTVNQDKVWTNYESYHRAYKNESQQGKVPEVYVGEGEYKELFTNEEFSATSFFLVDNSKPFASKYTVSVSLIYQVILNEIYPSISHRADEEVHAAVAIALEKCTQLQITSLVTSIADVYT